jgi:hypothetical protein
MLDIGNCYYKIRFSVKRESEKYMQQRREDRELPYIIARQGWRYCRFGEARPAIKRTSTNGWLAQRRIGGLYRIAL